MNNHIYYIVEKTGAQGKKIEEPEYMIIFYPVNNATNDDKKKQVLSYLKVQEQRRRRYSNFEVGKFIRIISQQEFLQLGGELTDITPKVF